jgi:hypothetical protein
MASFIHLAHHDHRHYGHDDDCERLLQLAAWIAKAQPIVDSVILIRLLNKVKEKHRVAMLLRQEKARQAVAMG